MADEKKEKEVEKAKAPAKVRMMKPHGFIDDNGGQNHWHQGQIVTDKDHIETLVKRGAQIEHLAD